MRRNKLKANREFLRLRLTQFIWGGGFILRTGSTIARTNVDASPESAQLLRRVHGTKMLRKDFEIMGMHLADKNEKGQLTDG